MATHAVTAPGYPIKVHPEDLVGVRFFGKTGQPDMASIRKIIGEKAMCAVLMHYHGVSPENLPGVLRRVKVTRVTFREKDDLPKHWGEMLVELLYRFKDSETKESYRHVFHFVSEKGGLSGRLFTQTRRHISR